MKCTYCFFDNEDEFDIEYICDQCWLERNEAHPIKDEEIPQLLRKELYKCVSAKLINVEHNIPPNFGRKEFTIRFEFLPDWEHVVYDVYALLKYAALIVWQLHGNNWHAPFVSSVLQEIAAPHGVRMPEDNKVYFVTYKWN